VTAGLIVCAAALAVAIVAGLAWRGRNGRLRPVPDGRVVAGLIAVGQGFAGSAAAGANAKGSAAVGTAAAGSAAADANAEGTAAAGNASAWPGATVAELGGLLGPRATLLQFSSAFCAPCRATRTVLAEVAEMTDGVAHLEIDAESHLELVRRLDVRRTPTVFVLGPDGRIAHRASGQPRKADVIAALGEAT
jgi:thiol-disulfide isomerase/thioredoxin